MDNTQRPMDADLRLKIGLLCRTAQLILENGGETYRVEETALRMAQGLGMKHVSVIAMQTSIFVEVEGYMRVLRINKRGTNLIRIDRTNGVSRRVARGEMTAQQAKEELEKIAADPGVPQPMLMLGYALSSACFSLLFGYSLGAFAVTFVIGLLVQAIQPLFSRMPMGGLYGSFTGGMLTAFLAQAAVMIVPYGSANAVIAGGIVPLLTGLLMTSAVRDTMYGDLISGMTRALEAMLLAASVALGVYVGLKMAAMLGGVLL